MTLTTLSVVICAYTTDRWERLQAAVHSVLEQDRRPEELLVVVDHCPPLHSRATQAFGSHGVRVVASTADRGLSGARNTGIAHATGDVLVFLDDDAVAEPGWLAAHARHYEDPDVIGVGGMVTAQWERAAPAWFPPEFGWVVGCSYLGQPTETAEIRNPIGANMSFRQLVLDAVGGFSHSLGRVGAIPRGCEETELSIRAGATFPGRKIVYEPRAVVLHHVPASRGRWSYFRRRCWSEGLSKADVSRLSDRRRALAAERAYTAKALPAGVRRNVEEAYQRLETAPLLRALAICAGFTVTTAGYAVGQARPSRSMAAMPRGGATG